MTENSATKPKKILVPIFNRAHYGRLRSVLRAIENHPKLELQIMTATPAAYGGFFANIRHSRPRSWRLAIPWYTRALFLSFNKEKVRQDDVLTRQLLTDGFKVDSHVPLFLDGGKAETMAKSVGLGIIKIVDELRALAPDVVFVNADRFEMMAIALAASYLNIPIAHNEGGDLSGTIDESIRHSITKLAHIHFTSTEESRRRVIKMGESPETVFATGSPAIDVIANLDTARNRTVFSNIDITKPYLLALFHPVATESKENNSKAAYSLVRALENINMPTVLLGSNIDSGSHEVGEEIRRWMRSSPENVYHTKHLGPNDFYYTLANAACAVGNSSSFIREGAYFGTPAVIVGTRQNKRERCKNIVEVGASAQEIENNIKAQLARGRYKKDTRFGSGKAGEQIANILATARPRVQKTFYEA